MTIEQIRQMLLYLRQDRDTDRQKLEFLEGFLEDLLERMQVSA